MSSLTSYFETSFNNQQEQWEKSLLAELKLTEVGSKTIKKLISGQNWPTLSLKAKNEIRLTTEEAWKKASITYVQLEPSEIAFVIKEDLKSGVRNFFFHQEALSSQKWQEIEKTLCDFTRPEELEVFILGVGDYRSSKIKVVSHFISGKDVHDQGGHSIQELATLSHNLVKKLETLNEIVYLGVYVDSHFFHNIAKIRAAKLLAKKILLEAQKDVTIKVVALTSYQGWTLYERFSNILRNETAVASAYIGGADHVQSAGYNAIFELETDNHPEKEHVERSRRLARNTTHILALESMLGVVEDAAYGSFHIENLTEALCEESWKLMQSLLTGANLEREVTKVREKRLEMVKTRKVIMSGMNDYPDVKEHLNLQFKISTVFRVARIFEELRLRMEKNPERPKVYVALYGEYSALNARLNFVKNYFELLGLEVHEPGQTMMDLNILKKDLATRREEIIVLCSLDEHYPTLQEIASQVNTPYRFIAGKYEMNSFQNLFAGQNVYEVLENLVIAFEGRKS